LTEWQAFYSLEPFGSQTDDLRAGKICSILVNTQLKKGKKPYTPQDFFPLLRSDSEPGQMSVDVMANMLKGIAKEDTGKKKSGKKKKKKETING
jgi:hypothetical protein